MKASVQDPTKDARKSVRLKKQRDGSFRKHWYGQYVEDGKHREVNLNVVWRGTPKPVRDVADAENTPFARSMRKAQAALAEHVEEARYKGRVEHLTERLIASKTGRAVEYARLADLPDRWRNLGRQVEATEAHLANCDAHFRRFIDFMQSRKPSAVYLYEIGPKDAAAFVKHLRKDLAPATAQYGVRLLNKALSRFLPVGAANPFAGFVGRRGNGESGVIHRKPFTAEELRAILDAAREDAFMYPLIVTAACTGMRRGDVCKLDWRDVDLAGGMLAVKTSKTEAPVEIPIFPPLRAVLDERGSKARGLVFPEAAAMLKENSNGLTWRFKKIVARALDGNTPEPEPEPVPAAEIEAEALAAIEEHIPEGERRDRMLETFRRYAAGESVRGIEEALAVSRSTVSADLHAVENWTGKRFMRRGAGRHSKASITAAVARTTRAHREQGKLSASVRDWHALRTTFVTLALSAGVPVELVQRVTGHKTVAVVMEHYFRPDREQFRAALTNAMPGILTGGKRKRLPPAEELAAIAGKLAAGTATEKEKARLRTLAAKVK